jgi:3-hydroxyacyl-CoA dehydrogenase
MQKLIDAGSLGNKAGKGLYRREKKAYGTTDRFVYNIKKGDYEPLAKNQVQSE